MSGADERATTLRVRLVSDRAIPADVNLRVELHEVGSPQEPLVIHAQPDGTGAIDLDVKLTLVFP